MLPKHARIIVGIFVAFLFLWACSARTQAGNGASPAATNAARGARLVGTWGFQTNGMDWKWIFGQDGTLRWMILGQTDMGGRPVDISGDGSYSFDGDVLLLKINKFAGVPGMWRSQEAAPGFDPTTKVTVHFIASDAMNWSFATEALGAQSFKVSRRM
jgi:hypothetical protein